MTCTYLDHHPTEASVVFCGVQDNGTLRYTGEEAWLESAGGDGGHCVVNWNDPYQVISSYVYLPPSYVAPLSRSMDGGESWASASPSLTGGLFYPPVGGAPPNPSATAEAQRIALGADVTWFSDDFGSNWSTPDAAGALLGTASALVYANGSKVYVGTTIGNVYSYTRTGAGWAAGILIGRVGGSTATGLAPVVTSIVADPADATGASFYVALGGVGDWRRVWHYDGTSWSARSGPSAGAPTSLLDVHFNTLEVDPANPLQIFAGADIGVWRSPDAGANWSPYAEGLPEAGVSHLRLHPTHRLLRAATYGRGVFERDIDATSAAAVQLYVRDTSLDMGRWATVDWLSDPESGTAPHAQVRHWESPNIKVDPPASNGTYQATRHIDFFQFVDRIVDESEGVATIDPSLGTAVNRVYVEVHNRGINVSSAGVDKGADGVQVMLLVANASAGLAATPLPGGYATNVQAGTPISSASWQTVGITSINGLRAGAPQVVEFDLPSTMLPPPSSLPAQSHYCLLALLHHPNDQFNNTETNADLLTIADRKVTQKNLQIVDFTGTLPSPGTPSPPLEPVSTLVNLYAGARHTDLVLDTGKLAGHVTLLLPRSIDAGALASSLVGGKLLKPGHLDPVVARHQEVVERMLRESRTSRAWAQSALRHLRSYRGAVGIQFASRPKTRFAGIKNLPLAKPATALLVFDPLHGAKVGDRWEIALMMVHGGGTVAGGSTYHCRVVLRPDNERHIQIDAEIVAHERDPHLIVRLSAGGQHVSGARASEATVLAVVFTAVGAEPAPLELRWTPDHRAFVGNIRDAGTAIRRITVVARLEGHEGRKTITFTDAVDQTPTKKRPFG